MRPDGLMGGGGDGLELGFGPDGHLDEGAAHAFVDGALSDEDAARVVLHVGGCARCAALVAEARGLVAAASGVLRRLDDGPGAVAVATAAPTPARVAAPARRWPFGSSLGGVSRAGVRAAAAALTVVAVGGSAYVASQRAAARPAAFASDSASAAGPAAAAGTSALNAPRPYAPAAAVPSAAPAPMVPPSPVPQRGTAGVAEPSSAAALSSAPAAVETEVRRRTGGATVPAPPVGSAEDSARPVPGVVAGEVRDVNGRPIAAADVFVPGTRLSTLTDSVGRFTLNGVPAGSATVRARRVGFFSDSATVAVAPADTVRARIELPTAALSLNQVVVTGAETDAPAAGPARSNRRMRRTGSAAAALGCFAVARVDEAPRRAAEQRSAAPDTLRLAPGGAVVSYGTVRGAWAGRGGDSLVITWADSAQRPLRLRRDGDRWAGSGARLTPAPETTAGCGGP